MEWNDDSVRSARAAESQTRHKPATVKGVLGAVGVFIGLLFATTIVWSLIAVVLGLTFTQEQAAGPWIALAGASVGTWWFVRRQRGLRRAPR